jgi:hypothetical protein
MYGMVNKSVEDMITATHGEEAWLEIKRRAGVTTEIFISTEGYPDALTYQLVAAASAYTQTAPEQILFAFGEHWVLNTARQGYGPMLDAAGRTMDEFLCNLPRFHDRVALLYPNLVPPRFAVTDRTERSLRLHYTSHRPGLTPFVEGLLSGIAKMYQTEARVTQVQARAATGGDTDIFLVAW